jgi:hypothetical protein
MESLVVRPAQAGDAADLARNWLEAARHYAELDADAFQVPAADGLVEWFEQLLGAAAIRRHRLAGGRGG